MKKLIIIYLLVFSMVTQPLGEALAQTSSQQQNIQSLFNQLKKKSGKKKITFTELMKHLNEQYTFENPAAFKDLFKEIENQQVPEFQTVPLQSKGSSATRLIFEDGKSHIPVEIFDDPDRLLRIGNDEWTISEINDVKSYIQRVYTNPTSPIRKSLDRKENAKNLLITFAEYNKLSRIGKIEYMLNLRGLLVAAHHVQQTFQQTNSAHLLNFKEEKISEEISQALNFVELFLSQAYARKMTGACVTAGYPTSYDESGTCRYENVDRNQFDLQDLVPTGAGNSAVFFRELCGNQNDVPCNPRLFGYKPGGRGEPFCVPRVPSQTFQEATKNCDADEMSPLRDGNISDAKKLVESLAKFGRGGDPDSDLFDGEDRVKQGEAFDRVNQIAEGIIAEHQRSIAACEASVILAGQNGLQRDYALQKQACDVLQRRKAAFEAALTRWRANRQPATIGVVTGGGLRENPPAAELDEDKKRTLIGLAVIGVATAIGLCATKTLICKKKKRTTPPDKPPQPPLPPEPPLPPAREGEGTTPTTGASGSIRGTGKNSATVRTPGRK